MKESKSTCVGLKIAVLAKSRSVHTLLCIRGPRSGHTQCTHTQDLYKHIDQYIMGLVGPRFGADRDFEFWGLGVKIAVRHTLSKARSPPNRGPIG